MIDLITHPTLRDEQFVAKSQRDEVIGILGGMGPLSSAEFLKAIYENSPCEREQETPKVIMYSDPTVPDRTEAILSGDYAEVLDRLVSSLRALSFLGATQIIVCCVTAHKLLKNLPPDLKVKLISLLDVIFEQIIESPEKRLLLCSKGSRQTRLFEEHELWPAVQEHIVLPDERDQDLIHYELIYQIKKRRNVYELAPVLKSLLAKYRVDSFISGCTEMHILARRLVFTNGNGNKPHNIDPLSIIAERIGAGTLGCRQDHL
jgi:aspartate racemase